MVDVNHADLNPAPTASRSRWCAAAIATRLDLDSFIPISRRLVGLDRLMRVVALSVTSTRFPSPLRSAMVMA